MKVAQIRQAFFDFFNEKSHKVVASAPMVIKDDPTLMFTNAGMNQFKDYFLGNKIADPRRVANSQKCLRVSGKHNDLEEVGKDTYHHTMFEMLGNWSFGDYFKDEAIDWAWELLTEIYKIDKDRLYVTVFEGDKKDGTAFDQESFDRWKKWISEDRILNGNKKDNFWEMGDVGPCGPCSEIHVDIRSDKDRAQVDGRTLVNQDHPQVIEVWNLVFIQFNRAKDGSLASLPNKHVDTGMGLERLAMVLQAKQSNYDSDVFSAMIDMVASKTGLEYGKREEIDIAIRVIVDHIRAIAFAIADGQLPANVKAGYVIRRILRRAVRYYYSYLNYQKPLMFELCTVLIEEMGNQFPELTAQKILIEKVIKEEEQSFLKTLEKGISKFEDYTSKNSKSIDGKFAFDLYDTFGFPIDLTQLMAEEKGISVEMEAFEKELQAQKDRSRKAAESDATDWVIVNQGQGSLFVGYDNFSNETLVQRYRKVSQKDKTFYHVVLNETAMYAESGGQSGDKGLIELAGGNIKVFDTKKENDLILHFADHIPEDLSGKALVTVDSKKRKLSMANHSATHLMHAALKEVLGDHVEQKGSFLNDQYLRFDFTHFAKVTDEEIAKVEQMVNDRIHKGVALIEHRNMPIDEAKSLGATALFGEKYGDEVRVVIFDPEYSIELCGGTHVANTAEIGLFKVTSESAVAAGVRRIEAVTSEKGLEILNKNTAVLKEVSSKLKNPKNLPQAVDQLLTENAKLKKQIEALNRKEGEAVQKQLLNSVEELNGVNFISAATEGLSFEVIKDITFQIKSKVENLFLIIGNAAEGKATLTIAISDEMAKVQDLHAGNLVRELAKEIKGGGGGQPFFATAGGKDASGIESALANAKKIITEKLSIA